VGPWELPLLGSPPPPGAWLHAEMLKGVPEGDEGLLALSVLPVLGNAAKAPPPACTASAASAVAEGRLDPRGLMGACLLLETLERHRCASRRGSPLSALCPGPPCSRCSSSAASEVVGSQAAGGGASPDPLFLTDIALLLRTCCKSPWAWAEPQPCWVCLLCPVLLHRPP